MRRIVLKELIYGHDPDTVYNINIIKRKVYLKITCILYHYMNIIFSLVIFLFIGT